MQDTPPKCLHASLLLGGWVMVQTLTRQNAICPGAAVLDLTSCPAILKADFLPVQPLWPFLWREQLALHAF